MSNHREGVGGGGDNTMMAYTRGGSTRKGNLFQASGICKGVDFTC